MPDREIAVQFAWYLLVGGVSSVVDVGGFALLQHLGWSLMVASPLTFLAGTACNYILSTTLAFRRGRFGGRVPEIGALLVVAGVGVVLNSLFVAMFLQLGVVAVAAKTLAIPCVLAWNFLARRYLVFLPSLPDGTRSMSRRLLGEEEPPPP